MIKAIIFDMDGLIVDSEPIQSKSFEIVMKELGIRRLAAKNRLIQKVGLSSRENWKILKRKYKINTGIENLVVRRRKIYVKLLKKKIIPMPGINSIFNLLHARKFNLGLASNSSIEQMNIVISRLGIKKYFSAIVSARSVKRTKPFPDIFLEVARKLNVKPKECIVLEDSNPGVLAAKRAGMKVIAVPSKYTKHHDFSKADLVVNSLSDINIKTIYSL